MVLKKDRTVFCPICGQQLSDESIVKDIEVEFDNPDLVIAEAYGLDHCMNNELSVMIMITEKETEDC